MRTATIYFTVVLGFFFAVASGFGENQNIDSLIIRLDWLAGGQEITSGIIDTLIRQVQINPDSAALALLSSLQDTNAIEKQLAVYVWALGYTKYQPAVPVIIDLHRRNRTELLGGNCLQALGILGGNQAGEYLMSQLDSASDEGDKYNIMNYLAQMQYENVLPKTAEILAVDPKEFYWRPIFVFGKMGDKSIPFLLEKINDKNKNVRTNAINILGNWLIPPEAAVPMQKRYWVESNKDVRGVILSGMERVSTDLVFIRSFFEEVVAKEKEAELVQYAREVLDLLDKINAEIANYAKTKNVSADIFQQEWSKLYLSAGHEGDYELLAISSTYNDEPKLKELRERILLRDSDEAFSDYQKINNIIIRNRFLK